MDTIRVIKLKSPQQRDNEKLQFYIQMQHAKRLTGFAIDLPKDISDRDK